MPERTRILIVLTPPLDPSTGGVQMSTVKMARMLNSQGVEVGVFSFEAHGHRATENVALFSAPESGNVANKSNHAALVDAISRFKPHAVISQMPYEHAITDTLRRASAVPRIGCLRNTLYSVRNNLDAYAENLLPPPIKGLGRSAIGRAALLAFHRQRHAKDLRQILASYDCFVMFAEPNLEELAYFVPDYDAQTIALIPNSIPNVADRVPPKAKRLLWLARVSVHQKRADLILPIWRKIAPQLPDWTLDIVGDGPFLDDIRQEISRDKLPRIELHGRQPSTPFFTRSEVFIMTSDFEGFPNTLIEAQSQGAVPVVVDSYPMVRWLIQPGENGLLTPKGDVEALARAVVDLCRSEERLANMAQGALRSAAYFTEEKVALEWRGLIDELIDTGLDSSR
ncbi:glycosyltransferase involved in cell wall biosynthesis [Rhodovulum bhavnagarense]|uniref:Glycosyltransferase involved in cell wall biosynthesis n=1 Tax=Rhodovulum bhavnagarense TaxID=992286 RepID=A0A4R2R9X5_9RHOB|nr:glycosyltransferase [Rhodovulum bhavnagarense]TCP58767.1 glycosyltransferase involved in cell wall biosynthesis [Rhodovulum bhavnagarense]